MSEGGVTVWDFTRLCVTDGVWEAFLSDWRNQCAQYGEDFDSYTVGFLPVLEQFVHNFKPDAAVYGLRNGGGFAAICFVNRDRIPRYTEPVLRIRHMILSPTYDFGNYEVDAYVTVLGELFIKVLNLSYGEMEAPHVKIHLRSPADRQFFAVLCDRIKGFGILKDIKLRGSWVYITK